MLLNSDIIAVNIITWLFSVHVESHIMHCIVLFEQFGLVTVELNATESSVFLPVSMVILKSVRIPEA